MPSAPASSHINAAATTLGSGARLACLTVATWSMFTLSLAVMALALVRHSSNSLTGEFGGGVAFEGVAVVVYLPVVFDAGGGGACACDGFVVEAFVGVAFDLAEFGEALEAGLEADRAARNVVPAD